MNNGKYSPMHLIIEILTIFISLAVIIWGGFLFNEYIKILNRDKQRIVMVERVQDGVENFYQVNHYYPGSPVQNEQIVSYADWHYLITTTEMKDYYDFSEFRDPCQPQKSVGVNGLANCPSKDVSYKYVGIECGKGCKSYKLVVDLEDGGTQEFLSKSVHKKL